MKKQEIDKQRKKLIWKHFWRRKRQEVWDFFKEGWKFLLIIQIIIFFSIGVGLVSPSSTEPAINVSLGITFIFIALGEIGVILLGVIVYLIIKWLRSNWRMATEDADQELNRRRNLKGKKNG